MTRKIIERFTGKTDNNIAFLFFVSAFILRSIYAVVYNYTQSVPETNLYYELAQEIIAQGRIFYETSNPYYDVSGPIIPWLNALTFLVFGNSHIGIYLVTALGSALITLYTYKTSRLFLAKTVSLFIGIWSVFYLFYFYYTPTPGKDIWMAFCLIFFMYLLIKMFVKEKFTYKNYIVFIVLYVISFHLDERYIVFGPFIFLFILYNETFALKKFQVKKSLIFTGLALILMIPWSIRNYHKYDRIIILTPRTQPYTDKLLGYEPKEEYFSDDFTNIKGRYYIHDYQIDSVIDVTKTMTDAGYKISDEQIEAMRGGKMPAPLTGIDAFWSRIRTMFEPFQFEGRFERTGYYFYEKSFKHNLATFLFYGLLFVFSIPGFYFLFGENIKVFYLFLSTIIIYALLHALTIPYTNWRYRLPLDAIFIIVGCFGLTKTFKIFKDRVINNT